jgi:ferric-dicitrate binding protein FerR (iron transport regulator)
MNAEEYLSLYEKYISGLCSAEEQKRLFEYRDGFHMLPDDSSRAADLQQTEETRIYNRIVETLSKPEKKTFKLNTFFKIAAILLVSIGVTFLYNWNFSGGERHASKATLATRPIKPGRNTAQLKLSDGSVIDLDQVNAGLISTLGRTRISKDRAGAIIYANNSRAVEDAKNTISVPVGGNYKVILPDGTAVWLNASSSLSYPLAFTGETRRVSLQGEAYFEVAKNPRMPFVVQVNKMQVTVLGTHFNVNAYTEHAAVQTTLVEGSVRLSQGAKQVTLKPGEQGNVDTESSEIRVAQANTNKVLAWKNGYFMFQDDDIQDIMQQIARWYDLEVEYRGKPSNSRFGGIYSRNKDINELLKGLELTGLVHFKIEGRRVIVMA